MITMDFTSEGATMDLLEPETPPVGFAVEPVVERLSYLYGEVFLYPPDCDAASWSAHPWLLTTTMDGTGPESKGFNLKIKPDRIQFALNHLSLVQGSSAIWVDGE